MIFRASRRDWWTALRARRSRARRIAFTGIALVLLARAGTPPTALRAQDQPARADSSATPDFDGVPPVRFEPLEREIEGWTVYVDPGLVEGEFREEGERALTMLANHLQRIRILVPAEPLARLQQVEIWIERDHPRLGAMQYHPSEKWLIDNGHDPRLARKVHITQARQLCSREQMLKHPAVILHELAHAYHDQVLGFEAPEVIRVFELAKEQGLYEEVLLFTGEKVRHYALTNHKEYFAEATEAYFYRNDFYPFVRAELAEFDPALHELLIEIWGPLN